MAYIRLVTFEHQLYSERLDHQDEIERTQGLATLRRKSQAGKATINNTLRRTPRTVLLIRTSNPLVVLLLTFETLSDLGADMYGMMIILADLGL